MFDAISISDDLVSQINSSSRCTCRKLLYSRRMNHRGDFKMEQGGRESVSNWFTNEDDLAASPKASPVQYRYDISIVDISTLLKNIDIDIDKEIFKISIFKEDLNNTSFYI